MTVTSPPVRPRRAELWALVTTHGMTDFSTGAVAALLPYFVTERHYSYAAVAGITLAATSLSSVAQPVFGYLSDRFPLRPLILTGLLVAASGVAVSGLAASSYWTTWAVVALSGIGVAAFHPPATIDAKEVGGGTNRAMSVFSVGGNVGVALAPLAVGASVGVLGLHATPLLLVPSLIAVVFFLVVQRRRRAVVGRAAVLTSAAFAQAAPVSEGPGAPAPMAPAESAPVGRAPVGPAPVGPAPVDQALPAFGARDDWHGFAWLLVVVSFWSVAYIGSTSFVSLYSIQRFHVAAESASIALTVMPAAGAIGTLAGGWLADRFGRLHTIRSGYLVAAIATAAIVVAPGTATVVVAAGVFGFALFLPFAPQITLSHAYLPRRVGTASGVTLGLSLSLGGFLTPALGALADASTVRSVFSLLAALLVIGFGCALFLRERREPVDAAFDR